MVLLLFFFFFFFLHASLKNCVVVTCSTPSRRSFRSTLFLRQTSYNEQSLMFHTLNNSLKSEHHMSHPSFTLFNSYYIAVRTNGFGRVVLSGGSRAFVETDVSLRTYVVRAFFLVHCALFIFFRGSQQMILLVHCMERLAIFSSGHRSRRGSNMMRVFVNSSERIMLSRRR